jgi:hypothetical protein
MAMRFASIVLGQLAKALRGNAEIDPADGKLQVPNIIMPAMLLPQANAFFYQAPTTGVQRKSFMQNDFQLFNFTNSVVLAILGPGLWYITWNHMITPEGAVNDLTSSIRLELGLIGADFGGGGPTVTLTRFGNTGLISQMTSGSFWIFLPDNQNLQFIRTTLAGLATGTNRSTISYTAHLLT